MACSLTSVPFANQWLFSVSRYDWIWLTPFTLEGGRGMTLLSSVYARTMINLNSVAWPIAVANGNLRNLLWTRHSDKSLDIRRIHTKNPQLKEPFLEQSMQSKLIFCIYTVVSYQNERFSSKWELPFLPPSSLELWRKERARKAALILMKNSHFDRTLR